MGGITFMDIIDGYLPSDFNYRKYQMAKEKLLEWERNHECNPRKRRFFGLIKPDKKRVFRNYEFTIQVECSGEGLEPAIYEVASCNCGKEHKVEL